MVAKPVRLSIHAMGYTDRRGFTALEVETAIRSSPWTPADHGRLECRMDFPYLREWNHRWYSARQVRPIFVDEPDEIVVVTVYTYYF